MKPRFYSPHLIGHELVSLTDDEAHHAINVMRIKVGASLTLFDGQNHEADAAVTAVHRKQVDCQIDHVAEVDRERSRTIVVAVALPKGDRSRSVIEKAVELGAFGLIPLVCSRSVARPSEGLLRRLDRYVLDASKQCGRNRLMRVSSPIGWDDLINTPLADHFPDSGLGNGENILRWVAHPSGNDWEQGTNEPAMIAIGPEGGLTDEEVTAAQTAGWACVSLGPRILRVETAVSAVLANL